MKRILRAAAWTAAPKAMFAAKNPRKAAMLKAAGWAAGRIGVPTRKRRSSSRTAVKGLAAAAVALPLGLWLGRRVRRGAATAEAEG